jgi:hypothetical protein
VVLVRRLFRYDDILLEGVCSSRALVVVGVLRTVYADVSVWVIRRWWRDLVVVGRCFNFLGV